VFIRPLLATIALAVLIVACGGDAAPEDQLGGATTREDASRNSFGLPAPQLTNEERRIFERGDSFFTQNWVIAPAFTDARDGLGPTFNPAGFSLCRPDRHGHSVRRAAPAPVCVDARRR